MRFSYFLKLHFLSVIITLISTILFNVILNHRKLSSSFSLVPITDSLKERERERERGRKERGRRKLSPTRVSVAPFS